jgi:hypothetical protein
MAQVDEKERGKSGGAAAAAAGRGVSAQSRATTQRHTNKVTGNPGVFIGTEVHGDWEFARYQAIKNTWVSASLAERGYDKKYGPSKAFGAYLGLAVDSNLEPLKNPDRIEPGQEYLIPIRKVATPVPPPSPSAPAPAPAPTPPPRPPLARPKTVEDVTPWVQNPLERGFKDDVVEFDWTLKYPSFEINDDPPPPDRRPMPAVAHWLKQHAKEIVDAERRFNVSRIAIAGAIAWEALENPQAFSKKSVGPGKIHLVGEGGDMSWPEAVEAAGLMPSLTAYQRTVELRKPATAILYIAAIYSIMCGDAEKKGWNLRGDHGVLGQMYHSRTPRQWKDTISKKRLNDPWRLPPGAMGRWMQLNFLYLREAVGPSSIP